MKDSKLLLFELRNSNFSNFIFIGTNRTQAGFQFHSSFAISQNGRNLKTFLRTMAFIACGCTTLGAGLKVFAWERSGFEGPF